MLHPELGHREELVLRLEGARLLAVYAALPLLAVLFATLVTQEWREGIDGPAEALATALFAMLVPASLLLLWSATQSWTRLRADGVDAFNGFSRRSLPGNAFRGYRRTRGYASVALEPTDPAQPPLRVPIGMLAGRASIPWLQTLHNLEREDLAARIIDAEADPRLGARPSDRRRTLRALRAGARAIALVGWTVAVWVWVYPRPYDLALLYAVALPIAAMSLHLWSTGLLRLDFRVEHPTPSVAALFYPPALAYFLRAVADINMVDYIGTLLVAMLGASVLLAILIVNDPRLAKQGWVLTGIGAGLLGFCLGLFSFANVQLDQAAPRLFHVRVTDRLVTSGKAHLDELILEPWGPFGKRVSAYVPPSVYDRVSNDDVVCVQLHQGRLGWRWFTIHPC